MYNSIICAEQKQAFVPIGITFSLLQCPLTSSTDSKDPARGGCCQGTQVQRAAVSVRRVCRAVSILHLLSRGTTHKDEGKRDLNWSIDFVWGFFASAFCDRDEILTWLCLCPRGVLCCSEVFLGQLWAICHTASICWWHLIS